MRRSVLMTLYELEQTLGRVRRGVRRRVGLRRPSHILGFRGYGDGSRALVHGRLLEARNIRPSEDRRTFLRSAVASYQRYMTRELPRERIEVRWGDHAYTTYSGPDGYFEVWVDPPRDRSKPGWNAVEIEHRARENVDRVLARTSVPVLLTGPRTEYGIISDIDDTIIETGVTNPIKRAYALFLSDAHVRLPFEGVCAFYAALEHGSAGAGQNPIFYVSSSPWNLYEHLEEFFAHHDIPPGPMFLRDWGITPEGIAPGGGHGHKIEKIRRIFDTFPGLSFVLIGDSGQEDVEHYATIAQEYPGRVLAIYIRSVHSSSKRRRAIDRLSDKLHVPFVLSPDTAVAARDAAQRGLIRPLEVPMVEEAAQEDHDAAGVLEALTQEIDDDDAVGDAATEAATQR